MSQKRNRNAFQKGIWNCDVIANFSLLGIFNENQISELRNSEILSLFINTNIPENLSFIKKASLKESFQPLR